MKIITTIHPYSPFIEELAAMPSISGARLNTVMPIAEPLETALSRLKTTLKGKDLWIDLKCRQLRTVHGIFYDGPKEPKKYVIDGVTYIADPVNQKSHGEIFSCPWSEMKISHKIKLDLSKGPIKCWLSDGTDSGQIVKVIDGDRLIMLDGPRRLVGGGESLNIMDKSLEIAGPYFTDRDLQFIEAAKKVGINTYMISYVEQESDIQAIKDLDPLAKVVAKIESPKGIEWARDNFRTHHIGKNVNLMAARGDMYVEVGRPDKILKPLQRLGAYDPDAIVASRILGSLRNSARPSCADITDIMCMMLFGYKNFMIGDDICFNKDALFLALDILNSIFERHHAP